MGNRLTVNDKTQITGNERQTEQKTLKNKFRATASKVYSYVKLFETKFWPYINWTNTVVKWSFQMLSNVHKSLQSKLSSVIAKMGMLSVVSFVLALKNTPLAMKALHDHIKVFGLTDPEGCALSATAILTNPASTLVSLGSVLGNLTSLGAISEIAFFSLIGLPLALGLLGYGTFMGSYNITQYGIHLHKMPKRVETDDLTVLDNYLKKAIGPYSHDKMKIAQLGKKEIKKKPLTDRKISIIRTKNIYSRHTDGKVYNIMLNLQKRLNNKTLTSKEATQGLKEAKTLMRRKITSEAVATAARGALVATLVASILFPISALAIPIVGGILAAITLGKYAYHQFGLYKGLDKTFTQLTGSPRYSGG